ncbi:MAG: M56 family metallopeptidase [Thermoanaerobaculia bacterium]
MTIEPWTSWGAAWLWRVALHSFVAGAVLYAWARHLDLPSGRTRRLLLAAVLVLPLATALITFLLEGWGDGPPGPGGPWFDSARVLAIPLGLGLGSGPLGPDADLRLAHLAVAAGAVTAAAALAQEVGPALVRARRSGAAIPLWLARESHALPGWERCAIQLVDAGPLLVATGGLPGGRPRLLLSPDVLQRLTREELRAVLRHENAHHRPRRWWAIHALFAARLVQLANPVALWAFRAYTVELELACDAEAAGGGARERRALARALLAVYEATDRTDRATREALKLRVDALLGKKPVADGALPAPSLAAAVGALLLLLPWLA